jgi:hypothetical protein
LSETCVHKTFVINHLSEDDRVGLDRAALAHTTFGIQPFDIDLAELFKLPDDDQGARSKDNPSTFRYFEVELSAERDTGNDGWTRDATDLQVILIWPKRYMLGPITEKSAAAPEVCGG